MNADIIWNSPSPSPLPQPPPRGCVVKRTPQVNLAVELESIGADIIQTEGKFSLDPSK